MWLCAFGATDPHHLRVWLLLRRRTKSSALALSAAGFFEGFYGTYSLLLPFLCLSMKLPELGRRIQGKTAGRLQLLLQSAGIKEGTDMTQGSRELQLLVFNPLPSMHSGEREAEGPSRAYWSSPSGQQCNYSSCTHRMAT